MHVEIRPETFDPFAELGAYQAQLNLRGRFGATATFIGTMREVNDGLAVSEMQLEHYPGMTEKHLRAICAEAASRWSLLDCLVVHRSGRLRVGDAIVLVAVWAAHRGDALAACGFIIEDLKARAPFWKKERLESGERWVEKNSPGFSN